MDNTNKQAIEISTIPVTIKIIQVGGKKLTVSVFNQIPESDTFFSALSTEERKSNFIGWVDKDAKYILYSYNNILLKYKINYDLIEYSYRWKSYGYTKTYKMKLKEFKETIDYFSSLNFQIYIAV